MKYNVKYISDDIKLSIYEEKVFEIDVVFEHHMLVWFISGETKIVQADKIYEFQAGDIFLIPKNQLATIIMYTKDNIPHKSVVMHLTKDRLKEYYQNQNIKNITKTNNNIQKYNNHPLLESCLFSLLPYFEMNGIFPELIASLKITEAISILRSLDTNIDNILANFEEIGKIELVNYMEKNFMFNLPLAKFAFLTGRSLSTFKRDFKKLFNKTPQQWLTSKRLELAYYLLSEKKKKVIDVYLEVGFENLSHFSFAFKKQFAHSPSKIALKDL